MGKSDKQLPKEVLEFFRIAGKKGGKKRWEGVPPEERSRILTRAVKIREEKRKLKKAQEAE